MSSLLKASAWVLTSSPRRVPFDFPQTSVNPDRGRWCLWASELLTEEEGKAESGWLKGKVPPYWWISHAPQQGNVSNIQLRTHLLWDSLRDQNLLSEIPSHHRPRRKQCLRQPPEITSILAKWCSHFWWLGHKSSLDSMTMKKRTNRMFKNHKKILWTEAIIFSSIPYSCSIHFL